MDGDFTQGEKKILLQFERFIQTDLFKDEVKRIRKLSKIPSEGIEPTKEDLANLNHLFRIPDNFPVKRVKGEEFPLKKLNLESKKLIELFPIENGYLTLLIKYFIIFNKFLYEELSEFKESFHISNVCDLEDAQFEFGEYIPSEYHEDDPDNGSLNWSIKAYLDKVQRQLWAYPVVVRIHPDASQRDVIEYIKKHWKLIKYYQDSYSNKDQRVSFKHSKTKENKELKKRNDFIYKHRHLSRKEIMSMVNKDFGADLDQGSIGKIISLERKKREKK
jgi:hypothetical protein